MSKAPEAPAARRRAQNRRPRWPNRISFSENSNGCFWRRIINSDSTTLTACAAIVAIAAPATFMLNTATSNRSPTIFTTHAMPTNSSGSRELPSPRKYTTYQIVKHHKHAAHAADAYVLRRQFHCLGGRLHQYRNLLSEHYQQRPSVSPRPPGRTPPRRLSACQSGHCAARPDSGRSIS